MSDESTHPWDTFTDQDWWSFMDSTLPPGGTANQHYDVLILPKADFEGPQRRRSSWWKSTQPLAGHENLPLSVREGVQRSNGFAPETHDKGSLGCGRAKLRMRSTTALVRELRQSDVSFVDGLVALAFGRPGRPQLGPNAMPPGEICYVAEIDGTRVGFGAARGYGEVAYIGPMAVDPSVRRQGIATSLLRALIAFFQGSGCGTFLLDATESGAPLYERFGFADVDRTDVYERDAKAGISAESAVGLNERDFLQAAAIDRRITGCDRRVTLRRFAQDSNASLAVHKHGFAITHGRVVGPWLADSGSVARILFHAALQVRPEANIVFVPRSNQEAISLVTDAGFVLKRSLRHLCGGGPSPMRRMSIFGQGSLAHG